MTFRKARSCAAVPGIDDPAASTTKTFPFTDGETPPPDAIETSAFGAD